MKLQEIVRNRLALALLLVCSASPVYASTGIFGYGIELRGTGADAANSGATTLYTLLDWGGTRLEPLGSAATLDPTSRASSTEALPTLSLGTFNPAAGDTLTLLGGALLSWQSAGETVGPAWENYRVSPLGGPFVAPPPGISLGVNEMNVSGSTGDLRWANESMSIDLLLGLAPGTYVLGTWGYADSSSGDLWASDDSSNYGASFTVVPEPASAALLGLGYLVMLLKRRS